MIKKIIFIAFLISSFCQMNIAAAENSASNTPDAAKVYQEGLKAAREGKANQELWSKGLGNPEMAKAYQEGLKAAQEAKANQETWENESTK